MVTFQVYAIKERLRCITGTVAETQKHTNFMQVHYMSKTGFIMVIQKIQAPMSHLPTVADPKQSC